jgi:5'-deoxynucleotidase YfbR-like HD superfamily hydrolase
MDARSILTASDGQILEIVRQLRVAYALKHTLRYATQRDRSTHSESVAEHVFALLFLSYYFLPLEDPRRLLDVEKVHRIIVFHDFGEIPNGDKPYHVKTAEHEAQERKDALTVFASLPPSMRYVAHDSWQQYDDRMTPEAKFVYALDKLEPCFELLDPVSEHSLKRTRFTYEDHIVKKRRATQGFPFMRRFVEATSAHMLHRGVFWNGESAPAP